eukprot:scaffold12727_cov35-Attheya_sp.AAC.1
MYVGENGIMGQRTLVVAIMSGANMDFDQLRFVSDGSNRSFMSEAKVNIFILFQPLMHVENESEKTADMLHDTRMISSAI